MSAPDPARLDEVVHQLMGTCQDLRAVATEEEADDPEFCQGIDDHIFCCAGCEWWYEQCEGHELCGGETMCEDCWQGEPGA